MKNIFYLFLFLCLLAIFIYSFAAVTRAPSWNRAAKYLFYTAASQLSQSKPTIILKVPFHKQERALSCEAAALTMALRYKNVDVSESDILELLPVSTPLPRGDNNTWGDPQYGFVGDVDGSMPKTGYGVYENPIASVARQFSGATVLENAKIQDLIDALHAGKPAVVWGTVGSGKDISWKTTDGKYVKAIMGEHARTLIGYNGARANPASLILLDPIYGKITWSAKKFLRDWALLDNKAVVID